MKHKTVLVYATDNYPTNGQGLFGGKVLRGEKRPKKLMAIIVLSGDKGARWEKTVRLNRKGNGDKILFTGGIWQ